MDRPIKAQMNTNEHNLAQTSTIKYKQRLNKHNQTAGSQGLANKCTMNQHYQGHTSALYRTQTVLAHLLTTPGGYFSFQDDTQSQLGAYIWGQEQTPQVAELDNVGEACHQPKVGEAPLNAHHHHTLAPVAPLVPHQHPGQLHKVKPECPVVIFLCTGAGWVLGGGGRVEEVEAECPFVYVEGQGEGGGEGSTGRGEERAGSAVNTCQHDARPLPSKTADVTCDFPADPMLARSELTIASISSTNSKHKCGVKWGIHSQACEWQQQQQSPTTWLYGPLPLFYLLLVQSQTTKAHLFYSHGYSYLGHDNNAFEGS